MIDGLLVDGFSPESAIEVVKRLRKEATTHFKDFANPASRSQAFAKRKAADAIDDLLIRNLESFGNTELAAQYKIARQTIAKTHTVEAALNEAGNIDMKAIARQLRKGSPLSGELETLGRFADAFPKAARSTTESFPGFSPLDVIGGGSLSAVSGSPIPALLAASRLPIRRGLLSGPAQRGLLTPATKPPPVGTATLELLDLFGRNSGPLAIAAAANR